MQELPDVDVVQPRPARSIAIRDLAGLAAIVVAADLLLYGTWGGLGCALFTAIAGVVAAITARTPWTARTACIAVALGCLAARSAWQASFATAVLCPTVAMGFAIALRYRDSYIAELVVSVGQSALAGFAHLARGLDAIARRVRLGGGRSRAIAIPVIVALVFVGVFAAANPVVEDMFGGLLDFVRSLAHLDGAWQRVAFWFIAAAFGAALVRPVFDRPELSRRLGPGHELTPHDADEVADTRHATARNVLVAVNAVFLGYNALDAVYLWAGRPPSGLDHTTYAHRGTFWLSIGLLLCTIVLGAIFRGAHYTGPRARRLRLLAYVWAGQGFVLAAGTLRRIQLYVDDSGLTYLKVVGYTGSVLVIAGLALVVVKVARGRTMLWLVRRQLDAFALAATLLAVAPVDMVVTSIDVSHIAHGKHRPLLALFKQEISPEGLPGMLRLVDVDDRVVGAGIAAYLLDRRDQLAAAARDAAHWTEYQGSRRWALDALDAAAPHLNEALRGAKRVDALERLHDRARSANDLVAGDRDY